ncbi:MAG TPA: hypothetical protein VJ875_02200 [Pyrinomonadaceae bacterium]|nr:hypothetical protein [Pyrinomonadaceae bacterium]
MDLLSERSQPGRIDPQQEAAAAKALTHPIKPWSQPEPRFVFEIILLKRIWISFSENFLLIDETANVGLISSLHFHNVLRPQTFAAE